MIVLLWPSLVSATANVRNLSVSPICYTAGGTVTVSFEVIASNNNQAFGDILFSADATSNWNDDSVWESGGAQSPPDSDGHDGGSMATMGGTAAWTAVSFVVTVPAAYSGTKYVIVNVAENFLQNWSWGTHIDNSVQTTMTSSCGTATNTPSVTPSATRTATPTATRTVTPSATPTFSASPTPSMPLVKTSNLSNATIGDTITFCIAYTNDSGATQTIKVWDTISSFLTYIACNNSCAKSGSVVSWSVASVAAGGSGSVCFWGTVNGYPFMPELMQVQTAALRQEDLDQLFAPLFSKERED